MEYKLELKPAVMKDGVKYKIIQITDVALHSTKKATTPSVGKKVQKAFEVNEPERIYSPLKPSSLSGRRKFIIDLMKLDPDFIQMVREEEAKGYKVLLFLPTDGVPVVLGQDTVEFMKGKKGKRLLRGLAKGKKKE